MLFVEVFLAQQKNTRIAEMPWEGFVLFLILATAIGSSPKLEICFLPGRLRWTLLPKERYGDSLSGRRSNAQPSRMFEGFWIERILSTEGLLCQHACSVIIPIVFSEVIFCNICCQLFVMRPWLSRPSWHLHARFCFFLIFRPEDDNQRLSLLRCVAWHASRRASMYTFEHMVILRLLCMFRNELYFSRGKVRKTSFF